jgi:hypothetical protein
MSFSTKISFVPRDSGEKSISFDNVEYGLVPLGRSIIELKEIIFNKTHSLNFREINSNGYYDYVSVQSIDEFLDFHKLNIQEKSFRIVELEQFISNELKKVRYNWVIIEVYEYES